MCEILHNEEEKGRSWREGRKRKEGKRREGRKQGWTEVGKERKEHS